MSLTSSLPSSSSPSSSSPSSSSSKPEGPKSFRSQWAWLALGLFLIGYGLFAFNAGSTLSPLTNDADDNAQLTAYIIEQSENGVDMRGSAEAQQTIPQWLNFLASISSSEYAYGDDGLLGIEVYYHAMPDTRRMVLSTHMMLGMVLMAAGFFQFWPAFRRRYRKTHRVIGVVYVVAAFASMSMSGTHLVNSGIANTYDTYAFHMGLWMMLVGVVFSVGMAGFAIFRKNIAQHMGWQAVGFGFLLTAPLQRLDWVVTAPLAGDLSFNEMNTVVNTILFVQATLAGYALFLLNRASSPVKARQPSFSKLSSDYVKAGFALISSLCLLWLLPAVMVNNLADLGVMERMVPAVALAHLISEVSGLSLMLFGSSLTVLALTTWQRLSKLVNDNSERDLLRYVHSSAGIMSAMVALFWGYQLGLPSHAYGVAGAGFMLFGLLLLLFMGLFNWALARDVIGQAVEWLQFLLLCCVGPAIFAISLSLLDQFALVPEPYLSQAAGYEIAFIVALFLPVLTGFVLSIYSAETKRYRLN